MRIDIISAVPSLLESPFNNSIIQRAKDNGIVEIVCHDLRDYTNDKHRKIDDYAFGGGAGMVMSIEPIDNCITHLKSKNTYEEVIYMSPDGEVLGQKLANTLSIKGNLILLCGHYKGVDERVREHLITKEISIGDFVLSGGELAAAVLVDAVVRLLPGGIGDEQSALSDSFQDDLIAPPVYTRPAKYKEWKVPEILTSGNTKAVDDWRMEEAIKRTKERRPKLLEN
jgi:tRNA (guanine37-N1)-methyltransferase